MIPALTRWKLFAPRNLFVALLCVSIRGGKELCGGETQARIRTDFTVFMSESETCTRQHWEQVKLSIYKLVKCPKPACTQEAAVSWALHAKIPNLGGRVLLVKLWLLHFTIYRLGLNCKESCSCSCSCAGLSLAKWLAWHHGYVANTLIVSVG